VKQEFFENLKRKLKECSDTALASLSGIRGLTPIKAKAAMYMMVKIDMNEFEDIHDDIDFAKKLLAE